MLLRTPGQITIAPPLVIEAAGQIYKQTAQFLYLGGIFHENADLRLEINRWTRHTMAGVENPRPDGRFKTWHRCIVEDREFGATEGSTEPLSFGVWS